MRALILCAGLGLRLRPITHSFPKHLIPILNKPVVQYGVEDLIRHGVTEIAFIVNLEHDHFWNLFGDGTRFGARFTYIPQKVPRGLGDAVLCGRDFIGEEDFVVFLGDNFLKDGLGSLVGTFRNEKADAALFLTRVENPSEFGIATIEGERITRLEEKPKNPASRNAIVGAYIFKNTIFSCIDGLPPSARGEIELTDAIQRLIERGGKVLPRFVEGWWRDTGRIGDIIEANRVMLEELTPGNEGRVDAESELRGRIRIGAGAAVLRSRLRGPILIGRGVTLEDSFVGPYTVLGDNTRLVNCEIEHSVIMAGSEILNLEGRIESSLIGHQVRIQRQLEKPLTHRLIVGDNCQISLR